MLKALVIKLSNGITRWRHIRVSADHLLLLVPRCLQNTDCELNLDKTMTRCKKCGRCDIATLQEICHETGIKCYLARGGREALAAVKDPDVHAVVAVACEKELFEGIVASFPKPVLGVYNQLTNGPCRNTRLDARDVRKAIEYFLR